MPKPVVSIEEIDIPNAGAPIYVAVISHTESHLSYNMNLEQPPQPNKHIGRGTNSGTPHELGTPTQLLRPQDWLAAQIVVSRMAAGNTDYKVNLRFFQNGQQVKESKLIKGKYTDDAPRVDIVISCHFK